MTDSVALFGAVSVALYVGHHVGDYWVQTDHQSSHKGRAGHEGRAACLAHVASYVSTQIVMLALLRTALGFDRISIVQTVAGLLVSGVTHYLADRREFGIMLKLARLLPGKARFVTLGVPRGGHYDDNPSLGTGAWALDQSWHLFWGVFVAGLIIAA